MLWKGWGCVLKRVEICFEGGGDVFEGRYVLKNVGMCLKGGYVWKNVEMCLKGICFEECGNVFDGDMF